MAEYGNESVAEDKDSAVNGDVNIVINIGSTVNDKE